MITIACGNGKIDKKIAKILTDGGAVVVRHSLPNCTCGWGHPDGDDCPASQRWFVEVPVTWTQEMRHALERAAGFAPDQI